LGFVENYLFKIFNMLGHSSILKYTSAMFSCLSFILQSFPKDLQIVRTLERHCGLIFRILTTVVLGASTLKIDSCFPDTCKKCFASALSLASSLCKTNSINKIGGKISKMMETDTKH
jgi:hypothetical protein